MNNFDQLPLRDIHLPDPVSWWPPAIGWWLLSAAVILIAFSLWAVVRRMTPWRRRKKLLYLAAKELDRIEQEYDTTRDGRTALQRLSILMRRVSMSIFGRRAVAGVCGQRWADWLANAIRLDSARAGCIRVLVEGPYRPTDPDELPELFVYCRAWLRAANKKQADRGVKVGRSGVQG